MKNWLSKQNLELCEQMQEFILFIFIPFLIFLHFGFL